MRMTRVVVVTVVMMLMRASGIMRICIVIVHMIAPPRMAMDYRAGVVVMFEIVCMRLMTLRMMVRGVAVFLRERIER